MRARIEDELRMRMQEDEIHLVRHHATDSAQPEAASPSNLEGGLVDILARILKISAAKIDVEENVTRYGVDSIIVTEIMQEVSRFMGVQIVPTVFFEASNIRELAEILSQRYARKSNRSERNAPRTPAAPVAKASAPSSSPLAKSANDDEIQSWIRKSQAFSQRRKAVSAEETHQKVAATGYEPIAIIGMQGQFPQSPDLDQFWQNLVGAHDCIDEVPANRWDWRSVSGDPDEGPYTNVRWGGFIDGIDHFDASFFSIAPNEAELMDPHHRLFMQASWALLESAGIRPSSLQGKRVGVFAGVNLTDYCELIERNTYDVDPLLLNGTMHMFCAGRVSFMLRSTGPSQAIDTACSSSLVAVHRAAVSLQRGESELAIAGGVNLLMGPDKHIFYTKAQMLSADGRSRAFAQDAAGYGRSDGLGVVLLKRLKDAERDGDEILAVIRGSSENHYGTAASLTALNPKAMSGVISDAMKQAQVDPRQLGYVECHGPCTTLGDSIEFNALEQAFAERYTAHGLTHPQQAHCGMGTVKSNIGHAETAAGIAGLLKVLLAMRHAYLPPSLYCEQDNPLINWSGTAFYRVREGQPWSRPVLEGQERNRVAGVSSFGAGGTNAHIIVEEYQAAIEAKEKPRLRCHANEPLLVPLSAKTPERLQIMARELLGFLQYGNEAGQSADLLSLSYTLQIAREAMQYRVLFLVRDIAELERELQRFVQGDHHSAGFVQGQQAAPGHRSLTDQGAELLQQNRLRELAQAWVAGEAIDWSLFYGEQAPRRMQLPTYPFAAERHWIGPWDTVTEKQDLRAERSAQQSIKKPWQTQAITEDFDWLQALQDALQQSVLVLYSDDSQRAAFMDRLNPLIQAAGLKQPPQLKSKPILQADAKLCAQAKTILILGPRIQPGEQAQRIFDAALTDLASFNRIQQQATAREPSRIFYLYEDASNQGSQGAQQLIAELQKNDRDALRLIEHFDSAAELHAQERLLKEWLADAGSLAPGLMEIRYAQSQRQVRFIEVESPFHSRFDLGLRQLEARALRGEFIADEDVLDLLTPEQVRDLDAYTTDRLYALMQAESSQADSNAEDTTLLQTVREALREVLKLSSVDDQQSFQNYGLNSVSAMRFATRLEKRLSMPVQAEWFLDHHSVRELTEFLSTQTAKGLTMGRE